MMKIVFALLIWMIITKTNFVKEEEQRSIFL